MKRFFVLFITLVAFSNIQAQELRARVSVMSNRVGGNVNKKIFQTLQNSLSDFVNTRKWSNDNFKTNEKIDCSFLLNVESAGEPDVYKASLTIQSARPVFNSSYLSPVVNYMDNEVAFKYAEFQQLEFSETRVSGNDPLVSNLTAVFAYWINIILGLDYDSFSPSGGNPYYLKAQSIVNNAPEGRSISGWKAFDGTRNRYWLTENLLNSRYTLFHDALYQYYRKGMDQMYDNANEARTQIIASLNSLNTLNTENPNTMILAFFFQGKTQELIRIFSKATPQEKTQALELLQKLDVTSSNKYKDQLK
ncbi:MAG: DUF4835 family protein [Chitinophagaceae bacterium]|nr:DUF4835 family protein [Chitinophagaceae bacterium]